MNGYNPEIHNRRSIRLKGYDYHQPGSYFVTICTLDKQHLLGHIQDDTMILSDIGEQVYNAWLTSSEIYPFTEIDSFVVMPNHCHAIIVLLDGSSERPSLSDILRRFKSYTTTLYRRLVGNKQVAGQSVKLWQRGFYEHIIRGPKSLEIRRAYIETNPLLWGFDGENPDCRNHQILRGIESCDGQFD